MKSTDVDLFPSNSLDASPSRPQKNQHFTATSIEHLLKRKDSRREFIVLENKQKKTTSAAWSTFGFPARLVEDDTYNRIPGFASCFQCKFTYTYQSDGSGSTKHLLRHTCPKDPSKLETREDGPMMKLLKSKTTTVTTLTSEDCTRMRDELTKWICSSIRPFNIVHDIGLQNVLQTIVDIGTLN